jgi:hypothetical protein
VKTCLFIKTMKIQDFPMSPAFYAISRDGVVNICVAKGCNSIHSAPKRCHLSSGSHSSGLEYSERIWKVVSPVAEHGTITKLLGNCQKVGNHGKPGFHGFSWIPWVFLIFHDFGEKCSRTAGKVVAAGGRDSKSAIRAHLVAEKLSLASYIYPQTCSEP